MKILSLLLLIGAALLSGAEPAAKTKKAVTASPAAKPAYSREKLDKLRASLSAQIAVRDEAENAMRSPTADEAAALATPSSGNSAAVVQPLKNGGMAVHAGPSNVDFLVAVIGADGAVSMSHKGSRAKVGKQGEASNVR